MKDKSSLPESESARSESAKPSLLVVAGLIRRGRACLVVERPQGKPYAGYWEFPGGKVKPGESLEAALYRELLEELGIRVLACRAWRRANHEYPEFRVDLHFIEVLEFAGEPLPLEGQGIFWLNAGNCQAERFLPADQEIALELFAGD